MKQLNFHVLNRNIELLQRLVARQTEHGQKEQQVRGSEQSVIVEISCARQVSFNGT